jgi:AmpD protein
LDANAHPYYAQIADLRVSAHFLIRRDGECIQFVSCDQRAWHAGQSVWQGEADCNNYSIGIELEGCDEHPFENIQYEELKKLIQILMYHYPHITDIVGHADIAPGRKTDPGPCFNWDFLSGIRK